MRLDFSSDYITDTALLDEQHRQVYATTSSAFGRRTEVLKFDFGTSSPSNLATMKFHDWSRDTITMDGQELDAKNYLTKPSWISSRRVLTATNDTMYAWESAGDTWTLSLLDGAEVGRSHSRSLGLTGPDKHPQYLEFSDDPRVLKNLDELIVTYVYLRIRQERKQRRRRHGAMARKSNSTPAAVNNLNVFQGGVPSSGGLGTMVGGVS
ncbi:hypothetical protein PENSPDRAFT_686502 [Peniophora sp. CONT]|nr:hypothetical protein PENSPDRAFT_686502 [Peniophora sp. CONT]